MHRSPRRPPALLLLGMTCTVFCSAAWHAALVGWADERTWTARELRARGLGRQVRLSVDGRAVELDAGVLIEDDGPAAGYSYKPNEELLAGDVQARKELQVEDPRARGATLLVGGTGPFTITVNGASPAAGAPAKAGNYWLAYSLPLDALRSGKNEVLLADDGRGKSKLWIARDDEYAAGSVERPRHPNRSAKSRDGGRTWSDERLGARDDLDGEYYVRLFLDQHFASGTLLSDVIDLGNLSERPIGEPTTAYDQVELSWNGNAGSTGTIRLRSRTGETPTPGGETWSAWSEATPPGAMTQTLTKPRGRYLQFELRLATADPRTTPHVTSVKVRATPRDSTAARADRPVAPWTKQVRVESLRHDPLVPTAIPFTYEPFDQAVLAKLRRERRLDDVVAGAQTEFELITRLAAWTARQWQKGHLSEIYPRWNALDILRPHDDGRPVGGFCQQYNLLFLQACESFGLYGRAVSLGPGDHGVRIRSGHEAVEIWSNEHRQWVYVDGDPAWYFVDAPTGRPLSLWELRQRQLRAWLRASRPTEKPGDELSAEETRVVQLLDEPRRTWRNLGDWPPLAELRMIPRSDFLQTPAPLPLNQGMRGWFWTGHYVWTDAEYPASKLYGHRVSHAADWNWTLGGVRITLEPRSAPGELQVHLETRTPEFGRYEARTDDGERRTVTASFPWKLRSGTNRLQVLSKNRAERDGPPSELTLTYEP